MQLGFVSAILSELSLEQVVGFAAECGARCVELMCWPRGAADRRYAGVTHVDVVNLSDDDCSRIKRLFADSGVFISGLGYYPNPLSADEHEARVAREHLARVIEAAPGSG